MSTTLEPSFLTAVLHVSSFKGQRMRSAQACLLTLGLTRSTFTGADLPTEITEGSAHLSGCAVGALVAQGLVEVVGRVKSPKENAKGRKLDLLSIPAGRIATAKAWLRANSFPVPDYLQMNLAV